MIIVSPKNLNDIKSRDKVTLQCENCGNHFTSTKNMVQAVLKGSKKKKLKYCSISCRPNNKKELKCEHCLKAFVKKIAEFSRTSHHYCSNSCANKAQIKMEPQGRCKTCDKKIITQRSYCDSCINKAQIESDNKTIKDTFRDGTNKYGNIRSRAKTLYHKYRKYGCQVCGYAHHVDICHIKDICKFDDNVLVKEVNASSNISLLCKNCHWELHHGLIPNPPTVEEMVRRERLELPTSRSSGGGSTIELPSHILT